MTTGDRIRDIKRPYRKKSFQTGYAQSGNAVINHPVPYHSYATDTHQATQVVRPGVDPATYQRPTRPVADVGLSGVPLDYSNYPWHMVSKGDSANLIQRQKVTWSAISTYDADGTLAGAGFLDDSYIDAVVVNVADVLGDNTWRDSNGDGVLNQVVARSFSGSNPAPRAPQIPPVTGNVSGGGSSSTPRFPTGGGSTAAAVSGTTSGGSTGELYIISGFGHAEASTTLTGLTYQIWIDGVLFMQWNDFQWAPTAPKRDLWDFDVPLVVERQIVFRVINETGSTINTGEMDAIFAGWSEQRDGYTDVSRQKLES